MMDRTRVVPTAALMHPLKMLATTVGALLVWGLLLAYAPSPAWANIITVNSTDDVVANDGECTLREAITSANTDAASGEADGECAAGFGEDGIDIGLTGTIDLAGALPDLSTNLAIAGPGADQFAVNGGGPGSDFRIFTVASGSAVSISEITVANGNASNGGGILNNEGGTLTVAGSTVSDNSAQIGGGINNRGTLTVTGSTISGNSASLTSVGGGGVFTDTSPSGNPSGNTTATIRNSTISGNTTEGFGGGVYNEDGRTVIEHSTITDNTAPEGQGSGVASYGDSFTPTEVLSTIVAANTNTDVDFVRGTTNSFDSNDYNLVGDGNATGDFNQPGDDTGVTDPGLDTLGSYGGPTQTHRLQSDSPAVDKGPPTDGDPTACPPPETDQRGVQRPQGPACDIGSFELEESENQAPVVRVARGGSCGPASDMRGTINLALSDPEDPPEGLTLSATSSNDAVLPDENISFGGGADSSRTMTVTTLTGSGTSTVTVTAADGDLEGSVEVRVVSGSAANDTLSGSAGSDMIFARKGIDTAGGRGSNDLLCGGNGRDALRGGAGADTVQGGYNDDELSGGPGADRFVGASGTDTATDFNVGEGDTKRGIERF